MKIRQDELVTNLWNNTSESEKWRLKNQFRRERGDDGTRQEFLAFLLEQYLPATPRKIPAARLENRSYPLPGPADNRSVDNDPSGRL